MERGTNSRRLIVQILVSRCDFLLVETVKLLVLRFIRKLERQFKIQYFMIVLDVYCLN